MYAAEGIERKILTGCEQLLKYGSARIAEGYWYITKASVPNAMERYEQTIAQVKGSRLVEPASALYVSSKQPMRLKWQSKKARIGELITVSANCAVRDECIPNVQAFIKSGNRFGSTGGIYYTVPNKSVDKIKALLTQGEEYLCPVLTLHMEDIFIKFWSEAIAQRANGSMELLAVKQKRGYQDVLSTGNQDAGIPTSYRGRRITRKDLDSIPSEDLVYLVDYMVGEALSFVIGSLVDPGPGKVWILSTSMPGVRGIIGARSDGDILEASFTNGEFTTISEFSCRQIFASAGGTVTNAAGESRAFGRSVTEMIWRKEIERHQLEDVLLPPFAGLDHVIDMWTRETLATAKEEEEVVIGEDIGLTEPLKSPADSLNCKLFVEIGDRVMPHLGSGFWFTTLSYVPYHIHFGLGLKKIGARAVCLGDDFNIIVKRKDAGRALDVLSPYVKVKTTQGPYSKGLGFATIREEKSMTVYITPRIQKTVTSSSQVSSEWDLPEVAEKGEMEITTPAVIEQSVVEALPVIQKLIYFKEPKLTMKERIKHTWAESRHEAERLLEFLPEWMKHYRF